MFSNAKQRNEVRNLRLGFTLIELLIVVAIIAILAAIAVPNFLQAQTRAKVSRAQADLRSIATAIEAYTVANNEPPIYGHPLDPVDPVEAQARGAEWLIPVSLTTPIAYISALPNDVFPDDDFNEKTVIHPFFYQHAFAETYMEIPNDPGEVARRALSYFGLARESKWVAFGHGPDRDSDEAEIAYDPTNGAVSNGDIARFGP